MATNLLVHARVVRQWLTDPNTYATVCGVLMLDTYGTDCLEWDPASFSVSLAADFGIQQPPQRVLDKINAFVTLLTTDQFFLTMEGFTAIAFPLNRKPLTLAPFGMLESDNLAWALAEASFILADEIRPELFSDEVRRYVGVVLAEDGFINPPDLLKFAIMPPPSDDEPVEPVFNQAKLQENSKRIEDVSTRTKANLSDYLRQLNEAPILNRNSEWDSLYKSIRSNLKV